MPENRRLRFMAWWADHDTDRHFQGVRMLDNLWPLADYEGVLPPTVARSDVYRATYTMAGGPHPDSASMLGWDAAKGEWIELDW